MSDYHCNYRDHVGVKSEKFFKTTLFKAEHLMIGLNCFEPGQVQAVHDHADQDKFYFVVEGSGIFTVGDDEIKAVDGEIIWAPAGVPHGVRNDSNDRLVVFMGIAPSP